MLDLFNYAYLHISIWVQNDKVSPAAVFTQLRGARKANNDQVAIDVEMDRDKPLDDEDDDKGEHISCVLNTDSLSVLFAG